MKHNINLLCTLVVTMCIACSPSAHDDGIGHNHGHNGGNHNYSEHHQVEAIEHQHESEHQQEHKHNNDEIILSHHDAERFGLKIGTAKKQNFNSTISISGKIEPTPNNLSTIIASSSGKIHYQPSINIGSKVTNGTSIALISAQGISGGDENELARIAVETTRQELDRITPLHADGIVSTKDYNAAQQAYRQALAAYSGNEKGSLARSASSGVITQLLVKEGEYVTTGQPIATISGNTRLSLRADLPEKYYTTSKSILSANFRPAYSDSTFSLSNLNGKLVSSPQTMVSNNGYLPIYLDFDNNGHILPGSFAEIYLICSSSNETVTVPKEAIIEQQGKHFLYINIDKECYEKRMVNIGGYNGLEYEITSGLLDGESFVSKGAVILKLAESSGTVPEGHSHNH
ncbi:MAG: efflux RND transporter periplasmic adaptor subunit [Muribaculaceae bacterium]|nr:efflux RND transporter periplasmic adaptor subunit [Muribaculaceae bacterium]